MAVLGKYQLVLSLCGACGKVSLMAFTQDVGVCVAEQILRFFGIAP